MTRQKKLTKKGKNLDWVVEDRSVAYWNNGEWEVDPSQVAKLRVDKVEDETVLLGYTSKSYETIQNSSIFDMLTPMLSEGVLKIANQGYLQSGRLVYVQCSLDKEYLCNKDNYNPFITVTNSHTGTTKLMLGVGVTRIVCENTFRMANHELDSSYKHYMGVNDILKPKLIHEYVNLELGKFSENLTKLQDIPVTKEKAYTIIHKVFGDKCPDKVKHGIVQLYRQGRGNNGETAYDLFNGVTDYISHYSKNSADSSLVNSLVGTGAEKSVKFLNHLLTLA